ncbi:tyrosine-type recombinase/integrase [Cedecea sp. NFIX57]|uniref:tyrosine-type recombinase/integrase n=1 Tax=Cedecea sp. NFIX57 TaxID=1566286 RepID=UPI000A0C5863|nr:site-specific integrase [Cedecea sp. NFIX57]SMG55537.1 Site-specific recombinase XerD [Cedecea sp. NFIX57]
MENARSDAVWAELLNDYFFNKLLRDATEWSYEKVVSGFRKFIGKQTLPEAVVRQDVLRWRRQVIKEQGLSGHTWNNKVTHMRALFNFAIKHHRYGGEENPFNGVSIRTAKKRKRPLSEEQILRVYLIMQQFEEEELLGQKRSVRGGNSQCALYPAWYWRTVLDTLRFTGMRHNQLMHIRLKDVCLKTRCIELQQEGSKTHREWAVSIVSQLQSELARLIDEMGACGAKPGDPLFDIERLLSRGQGYETRAEGPARQPLRSFFRRLSKECGFEVTPHRFRHTLATRLMEAPDRNLSLVKGLLGHRNVATTLEYITLSMDIASKTLERELEIYTDSQRSL